MFEQTNDDDWREDASFEQNSSELKRRMLGGANWFFWIAALSLLNSIISLYGGGWSFSIGLGFTQMIDALAHSYVQSGGGEWLKTAVFSLDLAIVGLFVAFGIFARRANMMAFVTGLILYILDAVLYFFTGRVGDFYHYSGAIIGVLIHAVAIYFIFSGLLAARKLNETK